MEIALLRTQLPKWTYFKQILFMIYFILFSDDCVYIFYICTDRVGKWPKNQEICSRLFEDCEAKINYVQSEAAIVDNIRIYSVTFLNF